MDVVDFLPIYSEFDKDIKEILGEYVDTTPIYYKKEFNDYRLEKTEKPPENPGEYMNHQIIMERFLSSHTPYNGMLVMHEPGTGKTCLSVAVIEKIRLEYSAFKGALILMKGKNLIQNYKKELVEKCTDGRYKIEDEEDQDEEDIRMVGYDDYGSLTANKVKRRINKKLENFYDFNTFEVFSTMLSKTSDVEISRQYSNRIIIIDEAHHLRILNENGSIDDKMKGQYDNIHRMLHLVKNCKLILMTGTPMVDKSYEIASLMNLILDNDHQLPIGHDFEREFMIPNKNGILVLNPDKEIVLKDKLHGKVSFLRSMQSNVKKVFEGEMLDLKQFKYNQFALEMKETQRESYEKSLTDDQQAIYLEARQSSLFIFPDGTYGKTGFNKYVSYKEIVNPKTKKKTSTINAKSAFLEPYKGKTIDEKLSILETYSVKYANCIRMLLGDNGSHFVYLEFVKGSGAIIFTLLLKEFGFSDYTEGGKKPKYALLTSLTSSNINKAIGIFNSNENFDGSKIKVIIGTKIISEGFTLKNVQHVHILTPHWNFSETDQAIARAFRLFSHNALLEKKVDVVVKIYLYTIVIDKEDVLKNKEFRSIDRYMYKFCENKDISIKSIEHLLKQVSFDCMLTKERNVLPKLLDYSRNCEYQLCDYKCENESDEKQMIDYSTFNLFYDQDEMKILIEKLRELFQIKKVYSLDELKISTNYFLLLKTIWYCIENKVLFDSNFLHYENNLIFLTNSMLSMNVYDSFYTDHIPLQFEFNFEKEVDKIYTKNLPIMFEKMKNEKDQKLKRKMMDEFGLDAKELMLEMAITSREKGEISHPIREYIIDFFPYPIVFHDRDNIVSCILGDKNKRCLDKKTLLWERCTFDVTRPVIDKVKNDYLYVGSYDKNGDFLIIKQTNEIIKDARRKPRGRKCPVSWTQEELLEIIYKLKIDPSVPIVESKTDIKLRELLKDNETLKKLSIEIDDLERTELVRLWYWLKNNEKGNMCNQIKNFFEKNGMMI